MIGKRYGLLTVLKESKTEIRHGKKVRMWLCKCDCGNEIIVPQYTFANSANTASCGCSRYKTLIKSIVGNRYGMLTVKSLDRLEDHKTYWLCECDCGNKTVVLKANLINGNTRSCGCMTSAGEAIIQRELDTLGIEYIHGQKFESLKNESQNYLEFDFGIYKEGALICLIEFQGIQHYLPGNKFGIYQREYSDGVKKIWCTENNIPLHEIRYDEDAISALYSILSLYMPIPCQASQEEGVTTISQESTRLVKFQRGSAVPQRNVG